MNLTVYNGSPRGKNSNSSIIARWILEGVESSPSVVSDMIYLNSVDAHETAAKKVESSDILLLVFPLYTDSMPGIVKAFIEKLQPYRGALTGKKLGFVIHSGFPETHHSRFVEKYLVWLARELDTDYMGTAICGGSEGFRMMPESMTKKKRVLFHTIGQKIVSEGILDEQAVKDLAGRERLSRWSVFTYRILAKTGLVNFYWNSQLKKNKAYKTRFAQPYL